MCIYAPRVNVSTVTTVATSPGYIFFSLHPHMFTPFFSIPFIFSLSTHFRLQPLFSPQSKG